MSRSSGVACSVGFLLALAVVGCGGTQEQGERTPASTATASCRESTDTRSVSFSEQHLEGDDAESMRLQIERVVQSWRTEADAADVLCHQLSARCTGWAGVCIGRVHDALSTHIMALPLGLPPERAEDVAGQPVNFTQVAMLTATRKAAEEREVAIRHYRRAIVSLRYGDPNNPVLADLEERIEALQNQAAEPTPTAGYPTVE